MKHFHFLVLPYLLLTICYSGCVARQAGTGSTMSNATTSALRVGTPGDYPPLTSYDSISKQFSGEDINLALQLGRHLGRPVIFTLTTWKDLSGDLESGKFDMAIGGITINAEREKRFIFSAPLSQDRKVALFRLNDSVRYRDLTTIDQSGVRVIENLGGTNEKFAQKNIHQASIQIIPNNRQIFDSLLNAVADVMFTDETEARYQQQLHPALYWIRLDEKISPSYEKAIMFRKSDSLLQKQVNNWLKRR